MCVCVCVHACVCTYCSYTVSVCILKWLLFNSCLSYAIVLEKKLLDPTLIPHKLEIVASSTLSPDNSELQSILQFTGPSRYWKPAANDMDVYIDINLKSNHNITAVELRGTYVEFIMCL